MKNQSALQIDTLFTQILGLAHNTLKLDLNDPTMLKLFELNTNQIYLYYENMNQLILTIDTVSYQKLIEQSKNFLVEIDQKKRDFEFRKSTSKLKKEAKQTNYEIAIALHYIIYKANNDSELNKNKVIELLYYLRKDIPKTKIENTTEYSQLKEVFGNDESRRIKILKQHGTKAIAFLESLGLGSVANCIKKDISN